ncbi:MAG: tyrosine-type recombinase/integrase [Acidimicrobiales bacterium]
MVWSPQVRRVAREGVGGDGYVVGHRLVDEFLEFAAGRARPNTVRAYAHDLKAFAIVSKEPEDVRAADVLGFVNAQRRTRVGAENVVRISDGGSGLSNATIRRRLAAVSAFYGYLITRGDTAVEQNPVPRGLPTRRRRRDGRGQPLVRAVRRLPRILEPDELATLLAALRTQRDRALVQAMVLGGLRRAEVLGLRLEDLHLGEWRVFINEGKGGHQRQVPVSPSFFATVASYLDTERPSEVGTDRVFVVLKGPRRGQPLSAEGLDEIMSGARARAGLAHGTCHELRHTCFTRLREAGMSIEALQAQAGHRSIASTQLYLHLGDGWLAAEYRRAAEVIEAQASVGMPR